MMNFIPGASPWLCKYIVTQLSSPPSPSDLRGCYIQVLQVNALERSLIIYDGQVKLHALLTPSAAHELDSSSHGIGIRNLLGKTLIPTQALVVPYLNRDPLSAILVLQKIELFADCIAQRPEREPEWALVDVSVRNSLRTRVAELFSKSPPALPLSDSDSSEEAQSLTKIFIGFKCDFPPQFIRLETVPIPAPHTSSTKLTLQRAQVPSVCLSKYPNYKAIVQKPVSLLEETDLKSSIPSRQGIMHLHSHESLASNPHSSISRDEFVPTHSADVISTAAVVHANYNYLFSPFHEIARELKLLGNTHKVPNIFENDYTLTVHKQPSRNEQSHSPRIHDSLLMSAEETPPAMRRNAFVHLPCRTRSMTGSRSWQQQSPCGASLTVEYKPLQNDDVSTDSIDDSEHERALPQVCQALIESGQIPLWEPNRHALVSDGDSVQPADKSNVTNLSTHLNNSGAEQDASNEIVIPAKVTESEVFEADCVTRKGEISYTADIEAEDLPMTQHYNESSKSSGSNESKGDNPLPRTNKFGNDESAETQKPTDMEIETEDNVLLEDDLKLNEKVAVIVMELKALRTLETVVRDKLYDIALEAHEVHFFK